MQTSSISASFAIFLAGLGIAHAQGNGLLRCRAVSDSVARLACYDALADSESRSIAAEPAADRPVGPGRAPTELNGEASFGLPRTRQPEAVDGADSRLADSFDGWGPNSRVRLTNGQVWQVIDGSSVVLPPGSRKVRVKRGALGSYYLDIDGLKTSPRVQRVE